MADFYNKALQSFPADYSSQIVPTGIQNNYVNLKTANGMLVRKRNSYHVIAQNKDLVTVQPSTTVPAALLNAGQLDFRIEKGVADVVDFAVLKHSYTNSSGGAIVLSPAQMHQENEESSSFRALIDKKNSKMMRMMKMMDDDECMLSYRQPNR